MKHNDYENMPTRTKTNPVFSAPKGRSTAATRSSKVKRIAKPSVQRDKMYNHLEA